VADRRGAPKTCHQLPRAATMGHEAGRHPDPGKPVRSDAAGRSGREAEGDKGTLIHARRKWEGLKALSGEAIMGIVGSDRGGTYDRVPPGQRQAGWAHRDRDLRECGDRGGEAEAIGRAGREAPEERFAARWDFRRRESDREARQAMLDPVAAASRAAPERGCGCADAKAATSCEDLLTPDPASWLFAGCEGGEPTNRHAQRMVRGGVLRRQNAVGSQSDGGCRFAERMRTVVRALRRRHRSVLAHLEQAIAAHRDGEPAPKRLGSSRHWTVTPLFPRPKSTRDHAVTTARI